MGSNEVRQVRICPEIRVARNSKAKNGNFCSERWSPRYVWGKDETGHPRMEASSTARTGGTWIGTNVLLWKLISSHVAQENEFNTLHKRCSW
jgi:hypothetical protein